ncbi:hypothetical protein B0A48_05651 [Cryoendolithus antarcticus]|uniref:Transposase Tc1-like domain-containing protein n=1 Tax=Cryoendolithus antarcticus TaxID=1507870 RepID=A0A1V8TBY5_9PEZI|nr:hypothetical protein B0A48_05651 [Cryoendolithus antarcticus]
MPTHLPPHITNRVKLLLDYSHPAAHIARELSLSKRTVERLRLSFELFNQPYPPVLKRLGRPPALNSEQERVLLEFMAARPEAGLGECVGLLEGMGVKACGSTVWRYLERAGWGRKPAGKRKSQGVGRGEFVEEGRRVLVQPPLRIVQAGEDEGTGEADVAEDVVTHDEEEAIETAAAIPATVALLDPSLQTSVDQSPPPPYLHTSPPPPPPLTPLEQTLANTWHALCQTSSPHTVRGSPLWLEIASHLPQLVGLPSKSSVPVVAPVQYDLPHHLVVPAEVKEGTGRGKGAGRGVWVRERKQGDEADEERRRVARERLAKGLRLT